MTSSCEWPRRPSVARLLVIVRGFNLVSIASLPSETNPILIIDPDTMLPAPVATQPFQAISPWHSEITEVSDSIDLIELPPSNLPQGPWADSPGDRTIDAVEDVCGRHGIGATEEQPHTESQR